ncbi:response regulator [Curvibacter sp. CHRR-16]|uniref:response regulator n=1 Tax=Curvibacter sp. CHRR-16 TaxID=2835872 RepID=UPI001BD9FAF8|nr:response regulator [Curvibacter sp. CHRR-16]MBT0571445.1 response regulator [Curvibacter sp. CHRR-16]
MGKKLHVLLAEDNLINQRLITGLLKQLGHTGMVVPNGQEVLRCLEQHRFDVLLLDNMMPLMDGLTTLKHLRERERSARTRLQVIVVTADDDPQCQAEFMHAGADDFLIKPVQLHSLQQALDKTQQRA